MKKIILSALLILSSTQAFCYPETRICNGYDVENQIVSLRQCNNYILNVYCQNPHMPRSGQRWVIVYER